MTARKGVGGLPGRAEVNRYEDGCRLTTRMGGRRLCVCVRISVETSFYS